MFSVSWKGNGKDVYLQRITQSTGRYQINDRPLVQSLAPIFGQSFYQYHIVMPSEYLSGIMSLASPITSLCTIVDADHISFYRNRECNAAPETVEHKQMGRTRLWSSFLPSSFLQLCF